MNILSQLRERFAAALACIAPDDVSELVDMVRPSQDARFGDYQANSAMPLAKRLQRPPRDVATKIVGRLEVADLCEEPQIAGPGFINLRIKDDWLHQQLQEKLADTERLNIQPTPDARTFVLDYSAPNVAKPMHVGHIRSTVIGASLERVLRFVGHRTVSDNHIGDWGTQFGMILFGYKNLLDREAYERDKVGELSRLYRLVNTLVEYHELANVTCARLTDEIAAQRQMVEQLASEPTPEDKSQRKATNRRRSEVQARLDQLNAQLADVHEKIAKVDTDSRLRELAQSYPTIGSQVLAETAQLHAGDPENLSLWREFLPACLDDIQRIYRRLDVSFDHTLGESFYQERLAHVVDNLIEKKLATESEGAVCVFLDGYETPMIVRKQDGAFLYATTDLATIEYRIKEFHPDAILYVVDHRQSLHFEQLFAVARLCGHGDVELVHVKFGTVLGEDGRPFKTRAGDAVGLAGLLDEAVTRALAVVEANDDAKPTPELSVDERRRVAEVVGIGAIKYADLAHNRESDYVFSYDKMLSMKGNTATYMQYSYARVRSIFARGNVDVEALRRAAPPIRCDQEAERALGLELLRVAEALDRVVADYRPNHLTSYLFDLAGRFAAFFEACPVLKAESEETRTSRLALCDLTARTLQLGLALLGIDVVEKM